MNPGDLRAKIQNKLMAKINRGINPIEGKEPRLAESLKNVISSGRLRAITDYIEQSFDKEKCFNG